MRNKNALDVICKTAIYRAVYIALHGAAAEHRAIIMNECQLINIGSTHELIGNRKIIIYHASNMNVNSYQ